jgi:hypothetical protein
MKKLFIIAIGALLATSCFAGNSYIAVEKIDDIVNGVQNQNSIKTLYVQENATIAGNATVSGDATVSGALSSGGVVVAPVLIDASDDTTTTGYTPAVAGQLLVGAVGGTNEAWIACGTDTNSWVLITD